ncbi:MAG: type III secretion system inner membrane ring subunit SctD [Desulfovibrio sp.]|nr:type III secretion system inner membrane ring subunit SctD [Desulfovibrio sp.]
MSDTPTDQTVTVATLYVLSGVHLGARIELTVGTWLLGSDDECDLILMGLARHHAMLHVKTNDDEAVAVSLVPREGNVFLDGKTANGETPLEPGKPWYLGETCFVWNLPDVTQETIIPQGAVPVSSNDRQGENLQENAGQEEQEGDRGVTESSDATAESSQEKTSDTNYTGAGDASDFQPVHMAAEKKPAKASLYERLRRPIPLIFLAIVLCAFSFTLSNGPGRSEYPAIVSDILSKTNLSGLSVSPRWPGVEVRGAVASESELERLNKAVQDVSFPVYLEVAVDDDMLRAVYNALGIRGFFPSVRMERGNGDPELLISAFMRDTLVEADAFAQLEKDVPSPPTKRRRIIYEKDAAPLIRNALQKEGFDDIQPVFLPGRVSFVGNLAPNRVPVIERIKKRLNEQFAVRLFGETNLDQNLPPSGRRDSATTALIQTRSSQVASPKEKHSAPATVSENPLGDLKLTGIFSAPLDFITTEDGRRFFPGSVLPNGNVLESINNSSLTLRKGTQVFTYSLRGNHE